MTCSSARFYPSTIFIWRRAFLVLQLKFDSRDVRPLNVMVPFFLRALEKRDHNMGATQQCCLGKTPKGPRSARQARQRLAMTMRVGALNMKACRGKNRPARGSKLGCAQCHRFFGHLAEVKDLPLLITGISSFSKLDKL